MHASKFVAFGGGLSLLAIAVIGCNTSTSRPAPGEDPSGVVTQDGHQDHDHGAHEEHGDMAESDASIKEALAELSEDDRVLAVAQRICPVTEEPLGSMGAPIKIDVNGKVVFICCEGCREKLLKNPDQYLAKLAK